MRSPGTVTLMQNYFKGWKAYYNKERIPLTSNDLPGISARVPEGNGIIEFRYEKQGVWIIAMILHLFSLGFMGWYVYGKMKKNIERSGVLKRSSS